MSTDFQHGFLVGHSSVVSDAAAIAEGEFDVALLTSSWDRRSVSVAAASKLKADTSILIVFTTRDQQGLRDEHDKTLERFAREISREYDSIIGDSVHVKSLWESLYNKLAYLRRRKGKPLTAFMDISGCPRYYFCAILASCLGTGILRRVRLFYAEGRYPEQPKENPEAYELFTTGSWNAVPVPGLSGRWDPRKQHHYVASVGFEGAKTYRTVSAADPDKVSILFPEPGFLPGYPDRTRLANAELFARYHLDESRDFVKAHAGDAIAAWKALSVRSFEEPSHENVYYSCAGTKPHAVALALRAMVLEYPALLYNLPEAHKVTDIKPAGLYWAFDIENVALTPE